MVDREKVVVILLIVTIILAVVSMVVTFSAQPAGANSGGSDGISNVQHDDGVGRVSFEVTKAPASSDEGTG